MNFQNYYDVLEFTAIKNMLAEHAFSPYAKEKALALEPFLSEVECHARMEETTEAKKILEGTGSPPLDSITELNEIIFLAESGGMLTPAHFTALERFLATCKRMISFLERGGSFSPSLAAYRNYLAPLSELREEINLTIRADAVDNDASTALRNIRRRLENAKASVQSQLEQLLRKNPDWFSENFVTKRGGRSVLPVKVQHKSKIPGTVVETSGTGATCFIEPRSVQKTHSEIMSLEIEEENEVIKILYTLTGEVSFYIPALKENRSTIQELDFLFAKAKFSAALDGNAVTLTTKREIKLLGARHPLLPQERCVPLNISFGGEQRGIIITGPNTGGKTVTLKTVGLLSLMAQSGLHIPAKKDSVLCLNNMVLCDIGDGQNITENLSTFSAHMTRVIQILQHATEESLVLLDELGSGTDPAEGMGLAVAVLQELLDRKCMFVTTTHYAEVKSFGESQGNIINARMAFDREKLTPLYLLELGESGESCAFYIAQRLGLPAAMLRNAHRATYGEEADYGKDTFAKVAGIPKIRPRGEEKTEPKLPQYNLGDSVQVSPENQVGIVYLSTQKDGTVGVQIKKEKQRVSYKRLSLIASAEQLYPPDYDFSILFDTVEMRKARHSMGRKFDPSITLEYSEKEDWERDKA